MKTPEISNVKVELSGDRACLSWKADDADWHVWLDKDLRVEAGVGRSTPTLYKRAPGTTAPRRLEARATDGNLKPMVDAAVSHMYGYGLMLKARARKQREDDERMRETETEARERHKRDAGPALYEALTNVLSFVRDDWPGDPMKAWAFRQAENAIAKADGRS